MTQEITVDHTPTKMATVWFERGNDGLVSPGKVVRITAKSIWVDTSETKCWGFFKTKALRFNLCKNGLYSHDGDKIKLYFEPNKLEEFLSNGL